MPFGAVLNTVFVLGNIWAHVLFFWVVDTNPFPLSDEMIHVLTRTPPCFLSSQVESEPLREWARWSRHECGQPSGGGDHSSSAWRRDQGALLRPGQRQWSRIHQGQEHVARPAAGLQRSGAEETCHTDTTEPRKWNDRKENINFDLYTPLLSCRVVQLFKQSLVLRGWWHWSQMVLLTECWSQIDYVVNKVF